MIDFNGMSTRLGIFYAKSLGIVNVVSLYLYFSVIFVMFLKIFGWFLCLLAYQPSWDIKYQIHRCRNTAVILFKTRPEC